MVIIIIIIIIIILIIFDLTVYTSSYDRLIGLVVSMSDY